MNTERSDIVGVCGPAVGPVRTTEFSWERENLKMDRLNLSRRDFGFLSAAAMGGLISGCSEDGKGNPKPTGKTDPKKQEGTEQTSLLLQEPHVCRGLNSCKGQGACKTAANDCKGKNACAGQGGCASVEKHACGGQNKCKGQGGCGEKPGENTCKGQGKCSVPLMDKAWTKARASFEKAYEAKHGKKPGAAPAKKAG